MRSRRVPPLICTWKQWAGTLAVLLLALDSVDTFSCQSGWNLRAPATLLSPAAHAATSSRAHDRAAFISRFGLFRTRMSSFGTPATRILRNEIRSPHQGAFIPPQRAGVKRELCILQAKPDPNEIARFKRWIRGDEEARAKMWQDWKDQLPPEEKQAAEENEYWPWEEYNFTQRMVDFGIGEHDEEGNFVDGGAGREIVWDKDPDGRYLLLQCPVEKLPIAVLDKQRFLSEHPGWFKDRAIFEDLYLGLVKKSFTDKLTDLEYAELGRLFMRYQHVHAGEPLIAFIEYYILQRGLAIEEFFEVTRAIHEEGTVYDFDALGKSQSSGIGDMAVEFITAQDDYGDDDDDLDLRRSDRIGGGGGGGGVVAAEAAAADGPDAGQQEA